MQPGDLVGFTTEDRYAKVIRWGQHHSPFLRCVHWAVNHIAIVESVVPEARDVVLIQAVRRVARCTLSSYGKTPHIVIPFPGFDERRVDAVAFAQSVVGCEYGVLSVISRAANMVTPKFVQLDVNRAGRMDCSTLGVRAWEHGGVLLPWPDPWQVTPGQIPDRFGVAS